MSQTLIPPGCLQRLHILSVLWLLAVPLDVPAYIWIPITENLRVQFFSLKLLIDNNGGIGGWVGITTSCAVAPLGRLCPGMDWVEQSV